MSGKMELEILKSIFFVCVSTLLTISVAGIYNKENVLIIIVDDMRPLLIDWGTTSTKTANINALAGSSIVFKNAYAQQALCAPSRNSFLTSRRPDTLRLYDFYNYWRDYVGNFTTLPQFFKENGYKSYSIGKVFHPGKSSNYTDDFPFSWTQPPFHPSSEKYKDERVCIDNVTGNHAANLICPVIVEFQPEGTLPDMQSLQKAISILNKRDQNNDMTPFFMAVGFHKPHIPFRFPQKYLDSYPLKDIHLAKYPFRPPGMPLAAWHPWTDVRKRDDIKQLEIPFPFGYMPNEWAKRIKQSYFASLSYIDDMVGSLLANVNKSNTIVMLTSDHGWSLGENGLWAKYSNFDAALKVPLILSIPGNEEKICIEEPVELVDIFPTLAELTGLVKDFPKCPKSSNSTILCTEGKSLLPLISANKDFAKIHLIDKGDKKIKLFEYATSQYPRPGIYPQSNTDKPRLEDIHIMGYTLRNSRHRFIQWIGFNNENFERDWNKTYALELYDHLIDGDECINLAYRPGLQHLVKKYSHALQKLFVG